MICIACKENLSIGNNSNPCNLNTYDYKRLYVCGKCISLFTKNEICKKQETYCPLVNCQYDEKHCPVAQKTLYPEGGTCEDCQFEDKLT